MSNDVQIKEQLLNNAKIKLKKDFIGIDEEIDQIFKCIRLWYLYPEFCIRPIVINLWGTPGVGKTDLIKKLVSYLNLNEYFCNVETTRNNIPKLFGDKSPEKYKNNNISEILLNANIFPSKQGILLIDEIDKGISKTEYISDLWRLLSDGSLFDYKEVKQNLKDLRNYAYHEKTESENRKMNMFVRHNKNNENNSNNDSYFKDFIYNSNGRSYLYYGEKNLMKLILSNDKYYEEFISLIKSDMESNVFMNSIFNPTESFMDIKKYNDIMNFEGDDRYSFLDIATTAVKHSILYDFCNYVLEDMENNEKSDEKYKDNMNESFKYSNLLIFIVGNIDEKFYDDKNIDENIYNLISELFLNELFEYLMKEKNFRPEQISRLGNNHIIYKKFTKEIYDKIVNVTYTKLLKTFNKKYDIEIEKTKHNKNIKEYISKNINLTKSSLKYNGVRQVLEIVQRAFNIYLPEILYDREVNKNK